MAAWTAKLTKRAVDAAAPEAARYAIHDTEISGFKLYVHPTGKTAFHLRYRVGGGRGATSREPKIGDLGAVTPDQVRKIAAGWVAEVRLGGDPGGDRQAKRDAPRRVELFERYLSDHARPHKRASSVGEDERQIRDHLAPALCAMKVADVTRANVIEVHRCLTAKPYAANRALAPLSKVFKVRRTLGLAG